jgi:hypothetical protein
MTGNALQIKIGAWNLDLSRRHFRRFALASTLFHSEAFPHHFCSNGSHQGYLSGLPS